MKLIQKYQKWIDGSRTAGEFTTRLSITILAWVDFCLVVTYVIDKLKSTLFVAFIVFVASAFVWFLLMETGSLTEKLARIKTEREAILIREAQARDELSALKVRLNDGVAIKVIQPYEGSLHPLGFPTYPETSLYWLPEPEQIVYVLEVQGFEVDRMYATLKAGQQATVFVQNDQDVKNKIIIHIEDLEIGRKTKRTKIEVHTIE